MSVKDKLLKYKNSIIGCLAIIALLIGAWIYGDGSGSTKKPVSDVTVNEVSTKEEAVVDTETRGNTDEATSGEAKEQSEPADEEIDGGEEEAYADAATTVTPSLSGSTNGQENEAVDDGAGSSVNGSSDSGTGNQSGGDSTGSDGSTGNGSGNAVKKATATPVPTKAATATPTVKPTDKNDSFAKHGTTGDEYSCTITIECKNVLDKLDDTVNPLLVASIPPDGVILKEKTIKFGEGDTVFNVLCQAGILYSDEENFVEYEYTPLYGSYYIEGIAGLYEFDFGDTSGWTYYVNGEFPSYGCSSYKLSDGDSILWKYVTTYRE